MPAMREAAADASLVHLGRALLAEGYQFTTVTPLTHAHVLARDPNRRARNMRDVFGWNLPFDAQVMPVGRLGWMRTADVLADADGGDSWRSQVRFSTLGPLTLAHGAYPTSDREAVFFGPDTYRFAAFLRQHVQHAQRAVDLGCGSGAGGLVLGARLQQLVCADLSVQALRMSAINAAINTTSAYGRPGDISFHESDLYRDLDGQFDLIIANPPYIQDDAQRLYRHGGDHMGTDLSVRIVAEGLGRLTPGGRLLLYTGSPVVQGISIIEQAVGVVMAAAGAGFSTTVTELDPDVFGEELVRPCYAEADRLAVVGVVITRRAGK